MGALAFRPGSPAGTTARSATDIGRTGVAGLGADPEIFLQVSAPIGAQLIVVITIAFRHTLASFSWLVEQGDGQIALEPFSLTGELRWRKVHVVCRGGKTRLRLVAI